MCYIMMLTPWHFFIVYTQQILESKLASDQKVIAQLCERIYTIDPYENISTKGSNPSQTSNYTTKQTLEQQTKYMSTSTNVSSATTFVTSASTTEMIGNATSLSFEPNGSENSYDDPMGAEINMLMTSSLPTTNEQSYRFTSPYPLTWADVAAGRRSPAVFTPRGLQEASFETTPHGMMESLPPSSSLPTTLEEQMNKYETSSEPGVNMAVENNPLPESGSQENVVGSPTKGEGRSNQRGQRGNVRTRAAQRYRQTWYQPIHRQQQYQDQYYIYQPQQYRPKRFPVARSQFQQEKYQPYPVPHGSKVFRQKQRQQAEIQDNHERQTQQAQLKRLEPKTLQKPQMNEHENNNQTEGASTNANPKPVDKPRRVIESKLEKTRRLSESTGDKTQTDCEFHVDDIKSPVKTRNVLEEYVSRPKRYQQHRSSKYSEQDVNKLPLHNKVTHQQPPFQQENSSQLKQHKEESHQSEINSTSAAPQKRPRQQRQPYYAQTKLKQNTEQQQYSPRKNQRKSQSFDSESKHASRHSDQIRTDPNTQMKDKHVSLHTSHNDWQRERTSISDHENSMNVRAKPVYYKREHAVVKSNRNSMSRSIPSRRAQSNMAATKKSAQIQKSQSLEHPDQKSQDSSQRSTSSLVYDGKKTYAEILKGKIALLAALNETSEKKEQMEILASQLKRALSESKATDQTTEIQQDLICRSSNSQYFSYSKITSNESDFVPSCEYTETSYVKFMPEMASTCPEPTADVERFSASDLVNLDKVAPEHLQQLQSMPALSSFMEVTRYLAEKEVLTTTTCEIAYQNVCNDSISISNEIDTPEDSSLKTAEYSFNQMTGNSLQSSIPTESLYSTSMDYSVHENNGVLDFVTLVMPSNEVVNNNEQSNANRDDICENKIDPSNVSKCETNIRTDSITITDVDECAYKPKYEPTAQLKIDNSIHNNKQNVSVNQYSTNDIVVSDGAYIGDVSKYSYAQILGMNLHKKNARNATVDELNESNVFATQESSSNTINENNNTVSSVRSRTLKRTMEEPEIHISSMIDSDESNSTTAKKEKHDDNNIQGYSPSGIYIPGLLFKEDESNRSRSTSNRRKIVESKDCQTMKNEFVSDEKKMNADTSENVHEQLKSQKQKKKKNSTKEHKKVNDDVKTKSEENSEKKHTNEKNKTVEKREEKKINNEEIIPQENIIDEKVSVNKIEIVYTDDPIVSSNVIKNETLIVKPETDIEEKSSKKKKRIKVKVEDELEKALREIADMEKQGHITPHILSNSPSPTLPESKNKKPNKKLTVKVKQSDDREVNKNKREERAEQKGSQKLKTSNATEINNELKLNDKSAENHLKSKPNSEESVRKKKQFTIKNVAAGPDSLDQENVDQDVDQENTSIVTENHKKNIKINISTEETKHRSTVTMCTSSDEAKSVLGQRAKIATEAKVTEDKQENSNLEATEQANASMTTTIKSNGKISDISLSEEASGWMDVIEEGGFTLSNDDDVDQIMDDQTTLTSENYTFSNTRALSETTNLGCSWIEVIEEVKPLENTTPARIINDLNTLPSSHSSNVTSQESSESRTVTCINEAHINVIRKVLKKITYIDGVPVETEEEVDNNDLNDDSEIIEHLPEETTKVIKRRTLEKVIFIDGKPESHADDRSNDTSKEEKHSSPLKLQDPLNKVLTAQLVQSVKDIENDSENSEDENDSITLKGHIEYLEEVLTDDELILTTEKIRRKVIKKIVYIDGEPVETGEVVKDPVDYYLDTPTDIADEKVPEVCIEEVPPRGLLTRALSVSSMKNADIDSDEMERIKMAKLKKKLSFSVPDSEAKHDELDNKIMTSLSENEVNSENAEHLTLTSTSVTTRVIKSTQIVRIVKKILTTLEYIDGQPVEIKKEIEVPVDEYGNEIIDLDEERKLNLITSENAESNIDPNEITVMHESTEDSDEPKKKVSFNLNKPSVSTDTENGTKSETVIVRHSQNVEEKTAIVTNKGLALKMPDHASDWMEIIDTGGFSLSSDDEDNVGADDKVSSKHQEDSVLPIVEYTEQPKITDEKFPSFNLNIPNHCNDWMDLLNEEQLSIDTDDEDATKAESIPNELSMPRSNDTKTIDPLIKETEIESVFKLPIPDHANDWMSLLQEEGLTFDDDEIEEPGTKNATEVPKNKENLTEKQMEFHSVNLSRDGSNEAHESKAPTNNDWISIMDEETPCLDNNDASDHDTQNSTDKVTPEGIVPSEIVVDASQNTRVDFKLPIPDHANDWMSMMEGGGFTLDSDDENDAPVPPQHSDIIETKRQSEEEHILNLSLGDDKPKPSNTPFNLPIPDHANDWISLMEGGGFTMESDDENDAIAPVHSPETSENKNQNTEESVPNLEIDDNSPKVTYTSLNLPISVAAHVSITQEDDFSVDDKSNDTDNISQLSIFKSKLATVSVETNTKKSQKSENAKTTSLSKVSVQTDSAAVKTDSAAIKTDSGAVKTESAAVKTDSAAVKTDSAAVKTDSAVVKTDSAAVKTDSAAVKSDSAAIYIDLENQSPLSKPVVEKEFLAEVESTSSVSLVPQWLRQKKVYPILSTTETDKNAQNIVSSVDERQKIFRNHPAEFHKKLANAEPEFAEEMSVKQSSPDNIQILKTDDKHSLGGSYAKILQISKPKVKEDCSVTEDHKQYKKRNVKIEVIQNEPEKVDSLHIETDEDGFTQVISKKNKKRLKTVNLPQKVEQEIRYPEEQNVTSELIPNQLQISTDIGNCSIVSTNEGTTDDCFASNIIPPSTDICGPLIAASKEKFSSKVQSLELANVVSQAPDVIFDEEMPAILESVPGKQQTTNEKMISPQIEISNVIFQIPEGTSSETVPNYQQTTNKETISSPIRITKVVTEIPEVIFNENEFPAILETVVNNQQAANEETIWERNNSGSYANIVATGEPIHNDPEPEITSKPYVRRNPPLVIEDNSEENKSHSACKIDEDGFQEIKLKPRRTLSQSSGGNESFDESKSSTKGSISNIYVTQIPDITTFQHPNRFVIDRPLSESDATIPKFPEDFILEDFYDEMDNDNDKNHSVNKKTVQFTETSAEESLATSRSSEHTPTKRTKKSSLSKSKTSDSDSQPQYSHKVDFVMQADDSSQKASEAVAKEEIKYELSETAEHSVSSYASILVTGTPVPVPDVPQEMPKPYKRRNPPSIETNINQEADKVALNEVDAEGFCEVLSKKERQRRRTLSSSKINKELEDEIMQATLSLTETTIPQKLIIDLDEVDNYSDNLLNIYYDASEINFDYSALNIAENAYYTYLSSIPSENSKLDTQKDSNVIIENEPEILTAIEKIVESSSSDKSFNTETDLLGSTELEACPVISSNVDQFDYNQQINILDSCSTYCNYDIAAIERAERIYYEYLATQNTQVAQDSWATVAAKPKLEPPVEENPEISMACVWLKKKYVQVVVRDDDEKLKRPQVEKVDEEGFTEYISKKERRRRLLSSCSTASDNYQSDHESDHVKDVVPYVPPVEIPNLDHLPNVNNIINEAVPIEIKDEAHAAFELEDEYEESEETAPKRKRRSSHKRSHKSSKISEAEKEVDEIIRQINEETTPNKFIFELHDVWEERWKYEDIEQTYYEMLERKIASSEQVDNFNDFKFDHKDDGGDSDGGNDWDSIKQPPPPSPPPPPPSYSTGDGDKKSQCQKEGANETYSWSDESTYLSPSPAVNPIHCAFNSSCLLPSNDSLPVACPNVSCSVLIDSSLCKSNVSDSDSLSSSVHPTTNQTSSSYVDNYISSSRISSVTAITTIKQISDMTDCIHTTDEGRDRPDKDYEPTADVLNSVGSCKAADDLVKTSVTLSSSNQQVQLLASSSREELVKEVSSKVTQSERKSKLENNSSHKSASKREVNQVRCCAHRF